MAHYLVRARPRAELLPTLEDGLRAGAYRDLEPFGRALTASLRDARLATDGGACWEEEDYCRPPLAQERAVEAHRQELPARDVAKNGLVQAGERRRIGADLEHRLARQRQRSRS